MVSSVQTEHGILVLRVHGTFDCSACSYGIFTCVLPKLLADLLQGFGGRYALTGRVDQTSPPPLETDKGLWETLY